MTFKAGLIALVIAVLLAEPATARPEPDRLLYVTEAKTQTADEDRSTYVMLQFYTGSSAYFDYNERIHGSALPTATARSFRNEVDLEDQHGREKALIRALIAAGACDLKSDPEAADSLYSSSLSLSAGRTDCDLDFNTPPNDPKRSQIHKLLMDFAAEVKIDRPGAQGEKVQTSQGDRETPQAVTFGDLVARPGDYDGKRIAVTGYVWLEFEGNQICAQPKPDYGDQRSCLWYGEPSSFAAPEATPNCDQSWARVEGIFFKGPTGHLGLWPGEIARLTKTEAAAAP